MDVSLGLYKIFSVVAKAGSFSKAARELYISQPAVSQSIRQLEEGLSAKLFIRSQHGIRLTQEGEVLLAYVQSALSLLEEGENKVERFKELEEGELRIGASDTVSKWYLLPLLEKFHAEYPSISISVTNRTSFETTELLKNGRIDLGFVNLPMSEKGMAFKKCMAVHDVFIAGEKYIELKDSRIGLSELSKYPLIMLEKASNSRRWVDRHFMGNGVFLEPQIELGAHDILADYAEIGLGIACVIREFSQKTLEELNLFEIKLKNPVPERGIGVCYMEEIGLPASARKFLKMLNKEGEENT